MSYRTILVHADAGPGVENRVRLAARLAQDEDARLIGAAAQLPARLVEIRAAGAAILQLALTEDDLRGNEVDFKEAERNFYRWITGFGLESEWRTAIDFPIVAIANMAATADLIVVGGAGESHPPTVNPYFDTGDLIMRAGRPVLVVPSGCDELDLRHVLVAWKNTREARRALTDALPFLKLVNHVTLLTVGESGALDASSEDAEAFLEHHGIQARSEICEPKIWTTSEQILALAKQRAAGLIVLGAFGHARTREWMFGGVTKDLLGHCPIPCLFSR